MTFAKPLKDLQQGPPNAIYPTGGMGLALDERGFVPSQALIEAWREVGAAGQPAYEGTWVVSVAGTGAFFCKDASGIVRLRGSIKDGTINTTAFTLPEGYRPSFTHQIPCAANAAYGQTQVQSDGAVKPVVGSTVTFDLTGISFRAA